MKSSPACSTGLKSQWSPFSSVQNSLLCAPPTCALPACLKLSGLPLSLHAASASSNSTPFLVKTGGVGSGAGGCLDGFGLTIFFLLPCFVDQAACFVSIPAFAACTFAGSVSVKMVTSSSLLAHCQCLTLVSLASVLRSPTFMEATWSWKSFFLSASSLARDSSNSCGNSAPPAIAFSASFTADRKSAYPEGVSGTTTLAAACSRDSLAFLSASFLAASTASCLAISASSSPAAFCRASMSCCLFLSGPM